MQRTEQKNKIKNILYAKRSFHSHPEVLDEQVQKNYRANLLKYFPKYIQTIQFQRFNNHTLTKLKRTKIIRKIQAIQPTDKMILQARSFLANKTKAVQKYYNLTDAKQIIQSLRRFPSIQTISLSSVVQWVGFRAPKTPEAVKKEIDDLYQIAKHIKGLSQLQSLDITFDKKEFVRVLRLLDSSKRIKHLKHLALKFRWKNSADQAILKDLIFEAKNLFHYTTYLNLGEFTQDGSEGFKELPGNCPNLQRISIHVNNCPYTAPDLFKKTCNPEPVTSDYLWCFEAFQKLERIGMQVGDVEAFFRDFALPISTKSIDISFFSNKNSFGFGAADTTPSLKENVKSPDFYDRWSKLENLESLNILDSDFDFMQEILKRVPKLKVLRLGWIKLPPGVESYDISSFFEPLGHINKDLEVLELEADSFSVKEEFIKGVYFPKLERLKIKGQWEKNDLKSYLGLLKTNSLRKNRLLEFGGSFYSQSEELYKLLEQFNNIYRAEDGLEMSFHLQIKINFKQEWKDEFIKQLEEFAERGREMKNVKLILKSPISLGGLFYRQLDKFEAFGKKFKEFEYF